MPTTIDQLHARQIPVHLVRHLPHHIRAVAFARFRLGRLNPVALAAVCQLQQMLPAIAGQCLRVDVLGAGQNIGGPIQRGHEQRGRTDAVLQAGGQIMRNAAERLQIVERVLQTVLVVGVEIAVRAAAAAAVL